MWWCKPFLCFSSAALQIGLTLCAACATSCRVASPPSICPSGASNPKSCIFDLIADAKSHKAPVPLPWACVAVPLSDPEGFVPYLFCSLPVQESPLPVHLHAMFELSSDRQSVKGPLFFPIQRAHGGTKGGPSRNKGGFLGGHSFVL